MTWDYRKYIPARQDSEGLLFGLAAESKQLLVNLGDRMEKAFAISIAAYQAIKGCKVDLLVLKWKLSDYSNLVVESPIDHLQFNPSLFLKMVCLLELRP